MIPYIMNFGNSVWSRCLVELMVELQQYTGATVEHHKELHASCDNFTGIDSNRTDVNT
jgi:hypothetical protein